MPKSFGPWVVHCGIRTTDDAVIASTPRGVEFEVSRLYTILKEDGYDVTPDDIIVNELGAPRAFSLKDPKIVVEFSG